MNDKTSPEINKLDEFRKWGQSSLETLRNISNGTQSIAGLNDWCEHTRYLIMLTFLGSLTSALRFKNLLSKYNKTIVLFLYCLINGFVSIAIMSILAMWSKNPFIFPSLGPTAFLYFHSPKLPASSPRNAFMGHFIGIAAGWLSLAIFGLLDDGPTIIDGVNAHRVFAAGLSLGLTCAFMAILACPHPPAGATTLIVSLGLITSPFGLFCMMFAVLLLTIQAFCINRLAGIDYPIWKAKQ